MTGTETGAARVRGPGDVEEFARRCFTGTPGDRIGVELEFLVFDQDGPSRQVRVERVAEALPALPGGAAAGFEPGGQLELSGPPAALPDAVRALTADVEIVRAALREEGLALAGMGMDPVRPPVRQLRQPRYEAMADLLGVPYGPIMMCLTASIQVNVDFGEHPRVRWERAGRLGPLLSACFANSPVLHGRPCGWMSGRQAVWLHLDPTRTRPVTAAGDGDPAAAWARYLMDARLMLAPERRPRRLTPPNRATFGRWMRAPGLGGHPPTTADLAYHATTVFPPVRPRGWLEVRYLDAVHPRWWPACVAVTSALLLDDRAAGTALEAAEPFADRWWQAAQVGLGDPRIRRAAETCFRAAAEALPRLGADPGLVAAVEAYAERHVVPGDSPAAGLLRACEAGVPPQAWLGEEVAA
ncbi:glutamate--cysteine ligase EgtA [Sphaerisporangium melleum]|uniref:Glutamate--cysteine ligase EgtA n=1 Tax=Sphaerisporangium melleum TaxID=321316 RepID=A0A917VJ78_9ACTN|nr:ergothioneine biosynthesis glutamate--cysteine ligase EgtA [Sphaerisporangium melleum]GGK89684.1 glutamate--cysteine ligase EgtA [Sphaerisporangium melleum]GII72525.1 glutamate--cysteine ligase EgtA [Sphaerisporangium melleum]